MDTKQHYDYLLGEIYSWMSGDFTQKQIAFADFLASYRIHPGSTGVAIDLGAAHGIQSVALARAGFAVKAIDFNRQLLSELNSHKEDLDIEPIEGDLRMVHQYAQLSPELIICWGDTITHLDNLEEIRKLIQDCYQALAEEGLLMIAFRDNSTEPAGSQKTIPVKQDDQMTLTCILDYETDRVKVTDRIQRQTGNGLLQKESSYYKVRLSSHQLEQILAETGFDVQLSQIISGFATMLAYKR